MKLLVGAAAALAPGCSGDRAKPDTPGNDGEVPNGGDDGAGTTSEGGDVSSGNDIQTSGYMVVDMLPSPSRCSVDAASGLHAEAMFREGPNHAISVVVQIGLPHFPIALGAASEIQVTTPSASPAKATLLKDTMEVVVDIAHDQRDLYISVPLTCGSESARVGVVARWDDAVPAPGTPIKVEIQPTP